MRERLRFLHCGVLQPWPANDLLDAVYVVVSVFLWTTFLAGQMYFSDYTVADDTGAFRPIGMDEAINRTLIAGTFSAIAAAVTVSLSLVLPRRFCRT
ncbi:hypothetical protein GVN18_37815 [Pseudomonas sp. ODNR1LW]|nr:hypothetical protein [Pseudomonas sp. ODNR1LW]